MDRGVPPSGALDPFAYWVANLLVGNAGGAAVLEITMVGPVLEVLAEADIALTGADMGLTVNGAPAANWQTLRVRRGDVVRIPQAKTGCRAYLAVTGGINVSSVMGSRSTLVRAKLGGLEGRILKKGDVLSRGEGMPLSTPRSLPGHWVPDYGPGLTLRAIPGPQDDYFTKEIAAFFGVIYEVSDESDRMGYRLEGPALRNLGAADVLSDALVTGAIQVPAGGQPIVLMADRQTAGGYAVIAVVASVDLSLVAQLRPGETVSFRRIGLEEAQRLAAEREDVLRKLECACLE